MKTTVIGAGGGGLASALLASLRGEKVTLIEAHSYLGGCASYFHRGPFCFDVGATTVSGVARHEPLGILFDRLGSSPELIATDPGIVFHLSDGRIIRYHRSFEKWMKELNHHFPNLEHEKFWREVFEINQIAWKFLEHKNLHLRNLKLLLPLCLSTELKLKSMGLNDAAFKELVDGILLISAQAKSEKIPFLVGAMALSYPQATFAPVGGMRGLMDFFEKECLKRDITIMKKSSVTHVSSQNVTLENGFKIESDRSIVNLPLWNIPDIMPELDLGAEVKEHPETWGAFTVYLGVKSEIKETYHQVHLKHPLVENYFVSFSLVDDLARAPKGWQTVSLSTHVRTADWFLGSDYEEKKKLFLDVILDDFLKRFGIRETKFVTAGTPKTFERYTGRMSGFVGGIPFLYGKLPLLPWKSKLSNDIYRVGDTTFPGQGLCGVVAGALEVDQLIARAKAF